MIAREDPFVGERIRRARAAKLADGVEQHHPVVGEQVLAGREKLAEMRRPDMFEHPDRNDPVEPALDLAVIDQFELDPVGYPGLLGAAARDLQLLLAQRHPEHIDVGDAVEIERGPAPAAADVEHALAGLEIELGGDMRLLVRLRLVEAVGGIGEVSAAVLAIVIEEQGIELVRQVVMMRHVAPRSRLGIAPEHRKKCLDAPGADRFASLSAGFPAVGADHHLEQVEDGPVEHLDPAIHIALADPHARIARNVERDPPVGEAHGQLLAPAGPEAAPFAVGKFERQPPLADELGHQPIDQRHSRLRNLVRDGIAVRRRRATRRRRRGRFARDSSFRRWSSIARTPHRCRGRAGCARGPRFPPGR